MEYTEFALHSVLKLEKDLNIALHETVKVKQISDLTQAVLNQSNKLTLIKLVNTLSRALSQSSELLKLAAADVDQSKSNQIRLQEDLLSVKEEVLTSKNEQIAAFTSTVKTEIKSFADVLGSGSGTVISQKNIEKAVKTAVVEQERLHNVMLYCMEESQSIDPGVSHESDREQVAEVMHEIGVVSGNVLVERVGERKDDNHRPVRVIFERKEEVTNVLARARRLKDSENFSSVFLGPDRTVEERKAHRKLVDELKVKRTQSPDMIFYIKENAVCSKLRPSH